jgi:sec-independent protein translocase protein TatA
MEMVIVMGIAVLLFGKRLPEVGRSLGKGIVEFKKGLADVTSGLDDASISNYTSPYQTASKSYDAPAGESTYSETAPKFEVPGAASTTTTPATDTVEYQAPAS